MKKFGKLLCTLLALSLTLACTGCSAPGASKDSNKVKVTMEDGSSFTIECKPEFAPKTCENFLKLVDDGFYNGLTFHRVIDNFVAQGGDPKGDGTGGSENKVEGEFSDNNFTQNTLKHTRGTVSMARSSDPNSATSQFFICYTDLSHLDGQYAAFGQVIEGMETVDNFLKVERNSAGTPSAPIVIKKIERIK